MCGRPSRTLYTLRQGIPAPSNSRAVPSVATISKPMLTRRFATSTATGLSRSRTLNSTTPRRGRVEPLASCDFA